MVCRTLFEGMKLTPSLREEADKLLTAIEQSPTAVDCTRAADRADCFVLGVNASRVLSRFDIESLRMVFEYAAEERRLELSRGSA